MKHNKDLTFTKTRWLTYAGILAALAAVLMLWQIPVWFAPPFYKLDLSEVVVMLSGFILGPIGGVTVELLKNLLNLLMDGTETAYVGELANLIMGCSLVFPAAFLYKRGKNRKRALIGALTGTLCLIIVASLVNYFVMIPMYSQLYGMPLEVIIGLGTKVNPAITNLPMLIVLAVMPFNLLKGAISAILSLLLYKALAPVLRKL